MITVTTHIHKGLECWTLFDCEDFPQFPRFSFVDFVMFRRIAVTHTQRVALTFIFLSDADKSNNSSQSSLT